VSEDLVQSVEQKICERQCFTISELLCEFPQIACTVLCDVFAVRLGYHKFCTRWVPKMLMGVHKLQRMALALTFLERYHKDGVNARRDHYNIRSVLWNTKNCIGLVIQNKRHGMLTSDLELLHDNARPHTTAHTGELFEHLNWELFDHPPYSPDLAPSNYHLFTNMKNWLLS
jgi:hypothetical protein